MNQTLGRPVIRILVADDHEMVRVGLVNMLQSQPDFEVVGEAENGQVALELFQQLQPDVMLVDLQMPILSGADLISSIMKGNPNARLVVITTYDTDDDIDRSLKAGATAYLMKDSTKQEIAQCVRHVMEGRKIIAPSIAAKLADRLTRVQLTARELEVLRAICEGLSNKQIAAKLLIAESTVKLHTNNLFTKLDVSSRTEALRIAVKRGLLRLD